MRPNRPALLAVALVVLVVAPLSHAALAAGPTAAGDASDRAAALADGSPTIHDGSSTVHDGSSTVQVDTLVHANAPSVADSGLATVSAPRAVDEPASQTAAASRDSVRLRELVVPQNTTGYLGFQGSEIVNEEFHRASIDGGGAVARDVAEIRNDYEALSFQRSYANTSGSDRVDRIRTAVTRIENRTADLAARQRRAVDRYNDGQWTIQQFLRELSTIDEEAKGLTDQVDRLPTTGFVLPTDLDRRMTIVTDDLERLHNDGRTIVGDAMAGSRGPFTVYVVTAADGFVVGTTDGQTYFREASLGANRATDGLNLFVGPEDPDGTDSAEERARQLYPLASDTPSFSVQRVRDTALYRVASRIGSRLIDTWLDGRTRDAFYEEQIKNLGDMPTETWTATNQSVALRVNRTHETGPMEVTVTDEDTGEPLRATVIVNTRSLGSTGADGQLWTIEPDRIERLGVVTADGRTVAINFNSS